MRRVVITGLGVIAPNGIGKEVFWEGCVKGISSAELITSFDVSQMTSQIACEVKNFKPRDHGLNDFESTVLDRHAQFAIACSNMAIEDAEMEASKPLPPGFFAGILSNGAPSGIAMHHGFKGPRATISDACSSGVNAIDLARLAILDDECDVCLAGGTDASVTPMGLDCYCVLGALTRRNDNPTAASRPFDRDRDGFVLGEDAPDPATAYRPFDQNRLGMVIAEGGGIFILEDLERAQRRGATIYGEIVGFAQTSDDHDLLSVSPDGEQYARCMRLALERAGLTSDEVGYVNADGRGTVSGDRGEAKALRQTFGDRASASLPISAPKSMTGNTLAGAGPIDLAFAMLAMRDGVVLPTINVEQQDPECNISLVTEPGQKASIDVALVTGRGTSGVNSALVIKRVE